MGVMPRSPKGRAAARGLDARLRLQHAFMPAGDASLKTAQLIKMLVDSNDGIYRGFLPWRLSDAGPGASRIVPMGRHPKPFTISDIPRLGLRKFRAMSQDAECN